MPLLPLGAYEDTTGAVGVNSVPTNYTVPTNYPVPTNYTAPTNYPAQTNYTAPTNYSDQFSLFDDLEGVDIYDINHSGR